MRFRHIGQGLRWFFGLALILPGWAAPGDLEIEVVSRTGDVSLGPGGKAFMGYEDFLGAALTPVGMLDDGTISFVGTFDQEGEEVPGFYLIPRPGSLVGIAESGFPVPGVIVEGEGIVSSEAPWSIAAASKSGKYQGLAMFSSFFDQDAGFSFSQSFLYSYSGGTPSPGPQAWTQNGSVEPKGNFIDPLPITDGRGESIDFYFRQGLPTMVVSDLGTLIWETKTGSFAEIIRATQGGNVSAVVLKDTPAPGFSTEDNAAFTERNRIVGVDEEDRTYFLSQVQLSSGLVPAVFRHNPQDNSLTTLLIANRTTLPLEDGGSLTASVKLEDLFVTRSGDLYFRAAFSSAAGFWKIPPTGEIVLLAIFSDFTEVPTNQGNIRFRGIGTGDWAVGNDDVIHYTGGVRNEGSGSDHGVWKLDPSTGAVTTLGRKPSGGLYGDAPGTDATYTNFRNLTASGDYVVFLADLSDGTKGIFATDTNGGVIKIALEGEPLDGSTITDLSFTPDSAGATLKANQGTSGLNDFGEFVFRAGLASGETALVKTTYEGNRPPTDNIYAWDGGAGTDNWHTGAGARTNWLDGSGVPRADLPPTDGTAIVRIGPDMTVVVTDAAVDVDQLEITAGSLEVSRDVDVKTCTVGSFASLVLKEGVFDAMQMTVDGAFRKEGDGDASLVAELFNVNDGEFAVAGGTLDFEAVEAEFDDSPLVVETGGLVLRGGIAFKGAEAGLIAEIGSSLITLDSGTFRILADTVFAAPTSGSRIIWGGSDPSKPLNFEFEGAARVLEAKGNGDHVIRKGFTIPPNGILRIPFLSPDSEFILELPAGGRVTVAGLLENKGLVTLKSGGIQHSGTGRFLNAATCRTSGAISRLDLWNEGQLVQNHDVVYGDIMHTAASSHTIKDSNLLPSDLSTSSLIFPEEMVLTISGAGESRVEFTEGFFPDSNFDAELRVVGSANAEIVNARMSPTFSRHSIDADTQLTLRNFRFAFCEITGAGKVFFRDAVNGIEPFADLLIDTDSFDINNAQLGGGPERTNPVRYRFGNFFEGREQVGSIALTNMGAQARYVIAPFTEVSIDGTVNLGGELKIFGKCLLNADIRSVSSDTEKIVVVPSAFPVLNSRAEISVPAQLSQAVTIGVPSEFLNGGRVRVGKNSKLIFANSAATGFFTDGKLTDGTWLIEDGASCDIRDNKGSSAISEIGSRASVSLGTTSPGGMMLGDLPSPTNNLSVTGKLILDKTILDMNTHILRNKNKVIWKNGAKVIGNMESIRGEVQGVIQLSGNINIEGSLTTDGTLSLGASPGTGLITGDLNLLPGSETVVEFAGTTPGVDFDFLEVGGTANLEGKLTLKFIEDYLAPVGQGYEFITASAIAGTFSEIDQTELGRSVRFSVGIGATDVTATAGAVSITNYGDWKNLYFTASEAGDPLISGLTADPDGDGRSNLLEYATNGLPGIWDVGDLSYRDGDLVLEWANGVEDYTWELQTSTDFGAWPTAPHTSSLDEVFSETSTFLLLPDPSLSTAPKRFYRIEVVPVEP